MSSTDTTSGPAAKKPNSSAWKNLLGLLPYLKRYPGGLALGLFTLALMGVVGNLIPLSMGIVTDTLVGSPRPFADPSASHGLVSGLGAWLTRSIPFYQANSRHTLVVYCVVLILCVALKGAFSFSTRWVLIGVSRDIEYDLRNDLFDRLLLLEPEFYVRNRTGELMSRATNDLNQVRMVLGPGIMYSATTLVTMFLAIAVMLRLSPALTMWVLVPVPVVFFVVRHFGKVIHELYEKIQASLATLSARVQENLSGVRVVRAYAQEEAEIRGFDEPNREYVSRNVELIRTWSMFMPALQSLIGTTFLLVLWQGGRLVLNNKLSIGAFIAFNAYLFQLVWPMIALGWVTNIFQRGAASMGRLNFILHAEPQIEDRSIAVSKAEEIKGAIEFRHLSFTYPTTLSGNSTAPASSSDGSNSGHPVLRDINLHVLAGSTLAIVGPTGSGKSTLAALIARLWEAPADELFIDGRSIREWHLETLRRSIGYVPQDTYLFTETVGENIAFGLPENDLQRVQAAAEIANFDGDVRSFPEKYDTIVGERGITLSGGQRQRTAIARAVIRDPRILILDDSLSSVDTQTEEQILSRLRGVMHGRTTILISHRVSTVREAHQIVVLRDGGIIERGTHEQLLGRGGYYADLYQKQLLEEELERA